MNVFRPVVLAALIFEFAASVSFGHDRAQGAEPAIIKLIALPSAASGDIYAAEDRGFFKAAGLDVRVTAMTNSSAIIAAVVSGAADIGFSTVSSAALARARGIPVLFIAAGALYDQSNPTAQLVGATDTAIRKAKDLNGKTVAVTGLADLSYYATAAWIEKNNGNLGSVKVVEVPYPEMAAALAQHRIDAAYLAEPFLTAAKDKVKPIAPVNDAVAPHFMVTGWLSDEAWIRSNPRLVARFAAVLRQAAQWANTHPKDMAMILQRYTHIAPDLAASIRLVNYGLALDPKLIQPPIDIAAKYGVTPQKPVSATDLMLTPPKP